MRAAHDLAAADDDRLGEPLIEHLLHRAQHALVLALGVDDALRARRGARSKTGRMTRPERKTNCASRWR